MINESVSTEQQTLDNESTRSRQVQLRDYQAEAVEKAIAAKKGTIKAPTGTGKTLIAINWLEQVGGQALVIVPTQALIYQSWTPKLLAKGYKRVGQYYAYVKQFGDPITITTFASAMLRPNLILDHVSAVVVDEVHHLGSRGALKRLLPKLKEKEYVLGLSSVPERQDCSHDLFLKEFPICYELSLGEAIRSRYVSPLRVVNVAVEMTSEEVEQYRVYTERIKNAFRVCGPDLTRWRYNGNFDQNSSKKQYMGRLGMWSLIKRKKLLSDIEAKKYEVLKIIQSHPDERVILFSESVPAIENIRKFLHVNGVSCETFHGGTESWRRLKIFENWGSKFQVLLSCRALDEGIDVEEVAVGILITNGKSRRQFIQRIGRIIRPLEGKQAKFYIVYSKETVEETYFKTIAKILLGSTASSFVRKNSSNEISI